MKANMDRKKDKLDFMSTCRSYLFTSESVTEGHPDKLADQISDAVLDEALARDDQSRVACETLVSHNLIVIAGEISSKAHLDFFQIIRKVFEKVGYGSQETGFDLSRCSLMLDLKQQSKEIAQAIEEKPGEISIRRGKKEVANDEIGAGDQGLMFGYATDETPELMPLPLMLAHRLVMKADELRHAQKISWLCPDGKSQVTVRYEGEKPVAIESVLLSLQHQPHISSETLSQAIKQDIIEKVIPAELLSSKTEIIINPSGQFTTGGPEADTGLTGRKIIVDTYGGACPHGGGCFSGKDPTKVDRSGAYAARYIAKNIVAARLAHRCTVQLSYVISRSQPTSLTVNTHGTGNIPDREIEEAVRKIFPLTPGKIIDELKLQRPIYSLTSVYGHFGRNLPEFTWEQTDRAEALRSYLKK
jgi:S-adenosylmethionine synthetase